MRRTVLMVAAVVAAGMSTLSAGGAAAARQGARAIYVTATDGKGGFPTDLTAADFTIKESGKEREITAVAPATMRLRLALLVEDSLTSDTNVRQGLFNFMQRMHDTADMSLVIVGLRNVTLVDYTNDLQALVTGINKFALSPVRQDEHLAEGIYDASKDLASHEGTRRGIVALGIERQQSSEMQPDQVIEQLRKDNVALYAITLSGGSADTGVGQMGDQAALSHIVGDGSKQSGGRRQEVPTTTGIPKALDSMAEEFTHQYLITYTLPDGVKPDGRVTVTAKRKGITVRAPSRIADK
jgi:VWFA-related protein